MPARKVSSKQINLDQRWIQNWDLEQNIIKLHVLTKKKGSQNRHKRAKWLTGVS